jgi:peroxiredoxin
MNIHTSDILTPTQSDTFTRAYLLNDQSGQPLIKGDLAPAFSLPVATGIWATEWAAIIASAGKVQLTDLLNYRPLVISFYSPHWNQYGHKHIQSLVALYERIKALGADMLVLTSEPLPEIYRLAKQYQLPFSIAQDASNLIAYQFGVYSLEKPVWQRVAGITADVAVPAAFVVAQNGQVAAAFIEQDFQDAIPVRSVLSAVYTARDKRIKKVA